MQLKHISKNYGNVKILEDINMSLPKCGLVTILGPSGSGKSTLLNIAGLLDPDHEGTVSIGEREIADHESEMQKYRSAAIGFIFQEYNLIHSISVKDNISTSLQLAGTPFDAEKYGRIMSRFDLTGLENRLPGTLSGGEKQRVAIARSLLRGSRIILADEPTGNLDEENAISIFETLKDISRDHLVIVATHNEVLAAEYSDRVIRLQTREIGSDRDCGYSGNENLDDTISYAKPYLSAKWYLKFSLSNFRLRKRKIASAVLSVIIALLSTALVLGFFSGFTNLYGDINLAILESDKIIVRNYQDSLFRTMDPEFTAKIFAAGNYVKTIQYYDTKVRLGYAGKYTETRIAVTDKSQFLHDRFQLTDGEYPINENEILLEEMAVTELFGDKICIGQKIELSTDTGSTRTCLVSGVYRANNEENTCKTIMTTELNAALSADTLSAEFFLTCPEGQTDNGTVCKISILRPDQEILQGGTGYETPGKIYVNAAGFNEMLRLFSPQYASVAIADIQNGRTPVEVLQSVTGRKVILQKLDLTAFATLQIAGICLEETPGSSLVFYLMQDEADLLNRPQVNAMDLYLSDYSPDGRADAAGQLKEMGIFYEMASDRIGSLITVKMSVINLVMIMISMIILFVSFLLCHFSVKMNIMDRTYDIGVLKSLGASQKVVFRIFATDNILMGLFVSTVICVFIAAANLTQLTSLLAVDGVAIYQFRIWHFVPIIFTGCMLPLLSGLRETVAVAKLSILGGIRDGGK